MEGKFNRGRRNFLRTGALAGASTFVPGVVKNFFDKEENTSEKELTVEDYLTQIEKINYNPEEAPEFLKKYAKEFKNWREVVESQRILALDFLNSDFVRNSLLSQYKEAYSEKSEEDITKLVDGLISDRTDNYNKTKLMYKEIKDKLGVYFPKLEKIVLDTIKNAPHSYTDMSEKDYETKTIDILVPLHEFWHSATLPKLIPNIVFEKILAYLAENNVIAEKMKDFHIKNAYKDKDADDRRSTFDDSNLPGNKLGYFQNPDEIYAFIMHIRGNLHIVSRYNSKLIQFNMFKDKFTQDHLNFLKKNQDKIFSNINKFEDHGGSMVEVTKNIFTKQLENFKDEQFVDLMNIAV